MNNINPLALPHFCGLTSKDLENFMFEFVFVFWTYDYASDDQKMNLFPSTLNDAALCWFMGLPENNVITWAQMQDSFSKKYRD